MELCGFDERVEDRGDLGAGARLRAVAVDMMIAGNLIALRREVPHASHKAHDTFHRTRCSCRLDNNCGCGVRPLEADWGRHVPQRLAKTAPTTSPDGGPERVTCCYEAGPTGYGSYRALKTEGYECSVGYGRRYPGKTSWTKAHIEWVGAQKFEFEAQRRVLADHLQEVHNTTDRVERLTRDIDELIRASKYLPLAEAL